MFKKAMPLVLISGLVLTGCANNETVPNNNETPMEKVEDRTRDLEPKVNEGQTGPNMDGLEDTKDLNGERNGVINESNKNVPNEEVIIDEGTNTPNEVIIDEKVDQNNMDRK